MMTYRNPILWGIKKQTIVAMFSKTAKILAINDALDDLQSIIELYDEVFNMKEKICLWEDNSSAFSIVMAGETRKTKTCSNQVPCHS